MELNFVLNKAISSNICIKNGFPEHHWKHKPLDASSLHNVKDQAIHNFAFGTYRYCTPAAESYKLNY